MLALLAVMKITIFFPAYFQPITDAEVIYSGDVYGCDDDNEFYCNDVGTECIDRSLVCNGVSECSTGRDEAVDVCGCLEGEFQCNTTVCIDIIRRCDRNKDCDDGKDEENCATYTCPPTHNKCSNYFCVPRDLFCDFVDNCGDNSDEHKCDYRPCYPSSEFKCNNSQCIPKGMLCDGSPDCVDGSDETNCDNENVYMKCGNGLYIESDLVCDGWIDCEGDILDEVNCGACLPNEFQCRSGRCVQPSNVCDGFCDCGSACDDENSCESLACPVGEKYMCKTNKKSVRCIAKEYFCDGINDCLNTDKGADEYFCGDVSNNCSDFHVSGFKWNKFFACPEGRCLPASGNDNVVCDFFSDCLNGEDEQGCVHPSCSASEFRCDNGQCLPKEVRCDAKFDCHDRSDELKCDQYECKIGYIRCNGGQCIPEAHWCDYFRDCPDGSDEMACERKLQCAENEFQCKSGQCISMDMKCYKGRGLERQGCEDGSNVLRDLCRNWTCTSDQFKCRNSFCIDLDQKCDQVIDCRDTFWDQKDCPYTCPYKSNQCICHGDEMDCRQVGLHELPLEIQYESALTKLVLSGNFFNNTLSNESFADLSRLFHIDLSNNSISVIPPGCFTSLWRLISLNLERNKIRVIKNGTFIGLTSLRSLYLRGNLIEDIQPYAFSGLSQLQTLDLSNQRMETVQPSAFVGLRRLYKLNLATNHIDYIADGAFNGLPELLTLDLSGNKIQIIENNVFHGLPELQTLYTDEFHFCCLARAVEKCYPEPDEFSSCEDLMSNYLLRISIWILGILAFLGNLLVFIWRIRDFRIGKVHSFLISNLAIGDFFMGLYLLIIAVVDTYYRGNYFIYDKPWRESKLCKFAGFISTFSSELSVFTLTVITLDRLICIIFPLKLKRLGLKEAFIVMPCVWLSVLFLSAAPLMGFDYFSNFFGRSGVCLALHITPEKPKGWEYSVFVFLVVNFVSFLAIFISYLWMFMVAKKTTTAVRKSKAKSDKSMAKRMTLIVMSDFCCWIPIILLGFASLGGARVPPQVYAWIAVFVLPLNSAINPVLYTISTAPFMRNIRKRASRFRKSLSGSFRSSDNTKHSYIDDRFSHTWGRNSMYRQLELTRLRGLKKSYTYSTNNANSNNVYEKTSRM